MSQCERLQPDLKAYLDGELSHLQSLKIRRHLRRCPACRQEIEQMEKIGAELRQQDAATLEPDLRAKLLSNIPNVASDATAPLKPTAKGRFASLRQKPMRAWATVSLVLLAWFFIAPYVTNLDKSVPSTSSAEVAMKQATSADSAPMAPGGAKMMANERSSSSKGDYKQKMEKGIVASLAVTPKPEPVRKTHRTAEMTVEVANAEHATESIENRVKTSKGGYLAETQLSTREDGTKTATLKIKIPVDEFDAFLSSVAQQGVVKAKSSTGEDITEKTSDTVQEQRSLTQQLEEARQRLQSARTRSQHNEASEEVKSLRVNIAEAEGRLELLKKLARLSDVTVTVNEKSTSPTKTGGFIDQIKDTAQAAEENFFIAARLPVLLLIWIAVYSPLWLFILFMFRLIRRQTGYSK